MKLDATIVQQIDKLQQIQIRSPRIYELILMSSLAESPIYVVHFESCSMNRVNSNELRLILMKISFEHNLF